jgi:Family of unknown function (DUF6049)
MSTRRVPAHLLSLVVVLLVSAPPAAAQGTDTIVAVLESQTPFVTTKHPELQAEILARNDGNQPLDNLSVRATVWSQALVLGTYEASLEGDPPGATIVGTHAQPFDGSLEPGQTRRFHIELRVQGKGVSTVQSYVYPLKLELLSGGTPEATMRSSAIVVVRPPLHPLAASTRVTLDAPLSMRLDGTFAGDELARAIAPDGEIGAAVDAIVQELGSDHRAPLDLVLSPVLLLQLERMRDGYDVVEAGARRAVPEGQGGAEGAARILSNLRTIARSGIVQISAWPFGDAQFPSLLDHLSRDVPGQILRGRGTVNHLVGARASAAVMYPPGSALTQEGLDALVSQGARVLLLDPAAAPADEQPLGFSPPAVRPLPPTPGAPGGDAAAPAAAVVPDAGVQALLTSAMAQSNPVLGAQQALGELAVIWLQQPGVERSIALAVPMEPSNARLGPAVIRRVAAAPFLQPQTATELVDRLPPANVSGAFVPIGGRAFTASYAARIKRARRLINSYRSTLVKPSAEPKDLTSRLLLLEGPQFLEDESAGISEIQAVDTHVDSFLGKIRPVVANNLVTLTSKTGRIPVQIVNETGQPVEIDVRLVSPHLTVGGGQTQQLTLTRPQSSVTFDVGLKTTGEFPVQIQLLAPSGRPISDITIAVRSTAYSRIALIITIGAAVALFALWGRRFLPSRRRTT